MVYQNEIKVKAASRGFHPITDKIEEAISICRNIDSGIANLFIKHTSAGLTINENADPTVLSDMESFFNRLVPEDLSLYKHTMEGPDDMTSHIKSTLSGTSLNIPIRNGKLDLGTWQGIFLCEYRDIPKLRTIVITIIGG